MKHPTTPSDLRLPTDGTTAVDTRHDSPLPTRRPRIEELEARIAPAISFNSSRSNQP